jgi:putative endonuclease
MQGGWVYILTNKPWGTLYIGVTNDLERRLQEHRDGGGSRFVRRYNLHRLVFVEQHARIDVAIQRETSLKRWLREWKTDLISARNPEWADLSRSWSG